jgi:hypothetical protein
LRGAEQAAGAAPIGLTLLARDRAAAHRALAVHRALQLERRAHVARAPLHHHRHHFGDHVAGAAHDHRVADAHVLASRLVFVVQRRVAHRRATDEHRLELGHRRQLAGAADVDLDAEHARRLLLRRVLVRHRPARLACLEAQASLQREIVDLVDHAVDVERQCIALGSDLAVKGRQPVGAAHDLALVVDRQAHRRQRVEQRAVRLRQGPALHLAEAIGEETQRAPGGDRRIELTHRTGGRVARVDEGLLVLVALRDQLALALVEPLERIAPDIDLAAHLEHRRVDPLQPQRDLVDRAQVVRDVLAGLSVTARGPQPQHAALVAQVDRQAVELQLGRVLHRRVVGVELERTAHPRVELLGAVIGGVGLGFDRQHRHRVLHRHQAFEYRADHALRRRIGRAQLGVLGFDRLQLLEQLVVFGVRNLRRVEYVVAMCVVVQQPAQLLRACGGLRGGRHAPILGHDPPHPLRADIPYNRGRAVRHRTLAATEHTPSLWRAHA